MSLTRGSLAVAEPGSQSRGVDEKVSRARSPAPMRTAHLFGTAPEVKIVGLRAGPAGSGKTRVNPGARLVHAPE